MKSSFNQSTKSSSTGGFINFPDVGILASDIDVVGNWYDQQDFTAHMKNGDYFKIKKVRADIGVTAYLEALSTQQFIDIENFTPNKQGYFRKNQAGLIIVPDANDTILGVLADNVSYVEDESTKKKKKMSFKTVSGRSFSAECTKDEFITLFKRARFGENVALWPEKWPHPKPRLSSLGLTSAPKAAIKLK